MYKNLIKTLTVLLAVSFSFAANAWVDYAEGKFQGQALTGAISMQKEADSLLEEIISLDEQIGTTMAESGGLVKALGEKETQATTAKARIDAVVKIMENSSSTDQLMNGFTEIETLTKEIRDLNKEAKTLAQ